MHRSSFGRFGLLLATATTLAACGGSSDTQASPGSEVAATLPAEVTAARPPTTSPLTTLAPAGDATTVLAVPLDSTTPTTAATPATTVAAGPLNVYATTGVGMLSPAVAGHRELVYVPSTDDGSVTIIDPATYEIIDRFDAGDLSQHVVPSWDLQTLYVNASGYNQLVPIDPTTGTPGQAIRVDAPYNLYFTPNGDAAVVMAERRQRIDFYDPVNWTRYAAVTVPCEGVNHADWTVAGDWFLASCEFSGDLLQVMTDTGEIRHFIELPGDAQPQDVRLVPDGSKFYVADMQSDVLWIVSANGPTPEVIGQIAMPAGTHGVYPSRDSSFMYVTARGRGGEDHARHSRDGEGGVAVVDPTTDTVVTIWTIPGGGSPDMGGVSADGTRLWLSGRFDDEVYVFDTATGEVLARIPVPGGPHGLAIWPQPGQFSLGHTGNLR